MQKKLDDLQEESKKVGLQINPLKTEEIRINTIINRVFKLNGEEIKVGLQINPLKTEEIRVNTIINRVFKLNGEEI